jgi:hypothetical protein
MGILKDLFVQRRGRPMMKHSVLLLLAIAASATVVAEAQSPASCADLARLKPDRVEITKAEVIPEGFTVPAPYPGAPSIGPLPAHCLVDGVINHRKGVDGQEFGIGFALALPDKAAWNGDFMMQGGGGGNGIVSYPPARTIPAIDPLFLVGLP